MMPTPENFAAYNALPIGVVMLREDYTIEGWNSTIANWSRVTTAEAVGQSLLDLFPDCNAERFRLRMQPVFESGHSVVISNAMHHQMLPLQTSAGWPLLHKLIASSTPGNRGRALLVVEDVTTTIEQLSSLREERRRLKSSERSLRNYSEELHHSNQALVEARQHAEAANAAKSEFLANMSHEIRTPLTAVKGFAEILFDQADSDFARDAAERVVRNSEHLIDIVNDILDLSRIEAGKMVLHAEHGPVESLLEDVLQTFGQRAEQRGIILRSNCNAEAPTHYHADRGRLRQVLIALVDNAIKFTESGLVCLRVESSTSAEGEAMVRFSVIDSGIGIEAGKLQHIFDPFTQEDTSTQRRFGGTGLGLAICKRLVNHMGGQIEVASEKGRGSKFSVTVPAGEGRPDRSTARLAPKANNQTAKEPGETPLAGQRILVAEDGPDNQRLIEYLLTRAGAELTLVENGRLAVDAVLDASAEDRFDLVVLDMQMPVMDGYTAAKTLRDAGVTLPIVALTAHAMAGDRDKAIEAGCDDYATKPIDPAGFASLLARLIAAEQPVAACQ